MNRNILYLLLFSLLPSGVSAADTSSEALDLLRKSEARMRSSATLAEYQVDIVRPGWQRTMNFSSADDVQNNRLRMEINSPRKTKGTVFLKMDNKLSMYLPKLRRQITISPAMMLDPWMGSDFRNQDLLESDALIAGHDHRIIGREGEGDSAVITIESIPKPTSTVSWQALIQKIQADGLPLEVTYLCKERLPTRRITFTQPEEMDGRMVPTVWTMQPLGKQDQQTVIKLLSIDFDASLDEALFAPLAKKNSGKESGGSAP
jgi:hypothetical protein